MSCLNATQPQSLPAFFSSVIYLESLDFVISVVACSANHCLNGSAFEDGID